MSKADLELVLAEPGPFEPGQTIEGFVGVTANTNARCRGLSVTLQWYTHGRGSKHSGPGATTTVFEGELVSGERALHPFSLVVPPGPFTYAGHLVNVAWRVRAQADLPWAFDPKVERPVQVVPGDARIDHLEMSGLPSRAHTVARMATGVGKVLNAVIFTTMGFGFLFCFGIIFVSQAFANPSVPSVIGGLVSIIVPSVFILLGLNSFRLLAVQWLANNRLRTLTLEVPEDLHPGQRVPVSVVLEPRKDLDVQTVCVYLTCQERAVIGAGTNRRTITHTAHEVRVVLATPGTVTRNGPTRYSGELVVPESAGFTFAVRDNSVLWSVRAVVDCPGPFDPSTEVPVRVVPKALLATR